VSGPHDTSPARLRQIAEDLRSEGWYTIAGTIAQLADELAELMIEVVELRAATKDRTSSEARG
jgi:hypothetical protein